MDAVLKRLSIANLAVGQIDPVAFVEDAAAAGFGAVGLLLMSATGQPLRHEIIDRPEVIRATRAALAATGTRVFDIEAFILSPGADMERYRRALATGAELGATHISSVGAEPSAGPGLGEAERVDLFGRLCDLAASFGLHVGIEFMRYRDIRTWRDALVLVQAAGRPNAGLIIDTLHVFRAGSTAAELATVPPGRVAYVQLSDASAESPPLEGLPAEARTSRLHLGDGAIPLHDILDAMPHTAQIVIETPVATESGWTPRARIAASAARARDFLAAHARRAGTL